MTPTEQLKLLIQRAADGELSTEQRHKLMELAEHQPDGWKQLACTFLEEQLVSQTIRQAPLVSSLAEESIVQPVRRTSGFWYHHPTLTTAVTICLAFALGVTVSWNLDSDGSVANLVQLVTDPVDTDPVSTDSQQHRSPIDDELRQQLEKVLRQLESLDSPLPGQ